MQQFIAHLHPVLVHLPIGILLIGCLFQWLVVREEYKKLTPAVGITLFWGMISSVLSCITGYLLSLTGEYEQAIADKHQYFGIAVALLSILLYYLYKKSINLSFARWLALILAGLIIITGHLGGSLTHGEDFLSFSSVVKEEKIKKKPIADIQAARAYEEVVKPILQEKCYSCHASTKQKGKLRLDLPEYILKGGKEGSTLVAGDPDKSELVKRLLLARNDEHHMPPKEKPQLTENEIAILHWWVQTGASFDKAVKELVQSEKIKPILSSLQNSSTLQASLPDIPTTEVKPAKADALAKLKSRGITVLPVAQNSNYLQVSFINTDTVSVNTIRLLEEIKDQLVWLKLSNQRINDSAVTVIAAFKNLIRLQLDRTDITDKGLAELTNLSQLQYLNLVGTSVTGQGVLKLAGLKNLKAIYLYQSKVDPDSWTRLKQSFPSTNIDSGGYKVPTLESDTTLVVEKAR